MSQSDSKVSQIEDRKIKHIELARNNESQMSFSPFDAYDLPYYALPEIDMADVDTSVELCGKKVNQPLIIASMTGGAVHAETINSNLARAAQEAGVAMGVGSQRIMLKEKDAINSFKVARKNAPDAFIFSNIGAVQLNYGVTVDDVRTIIDAVEANALYIHVNPLQEALQPEGDTNFKDLLSKLEKLIVALDIPVFVKEVGHGINGEIADELVQIGASGIDVAGTGGTSWSWIEAKRGTSQNYDTWFKEYGIPTDIAVQECADICDENGVTLVASGGVRSPIDGLKALFMGADFYSAAQPFLEAALDSDEAVLNVLREWEKGLRVAMFTAGITEL